MRIIEEIQARNKGLEALHPIAVANCWIKFGILLPHQIKEFYEALEYEAPEIIQKAMDFQRLRNYAEQTVL